MKLTPSRILLLTGLLLATVVLGRFYAKPVLAQVRAALVQNTDEPGRNPYRASLLFNQDATVCPNNLNCALTFPAVPAGHRLVITYASARYSLATGGTEGYVNLSVNGGFSGVDAPLPAPQYIGFNYYVTASPVTYYVEAGQQPTIFLAGNPVRISGNSSEVFISGYLVTLP